MANKQLLSRVVANHLVLEALSKAGQLAGLARLLTYTGALLSAGQLGGGC